MATNTNENCQSESTDDLLTTIYDVTRTIFRNLPIRSIDSCSLVCRSWAHMARFIKTHRHTIHSLTYPSDCSNSIKNSLSDFDVFMSSFINNKLWSIPYFALIVVTNEFEEEGFHLSTSSSPPMKSSRSNRFQTTTVKQTERFDTSEALIRHLNKNCQIMKIISSGIVTTNDQNQSNEIESGNSMGIILFPKFPSNVLGIYPFEISRYARISNEMSRKDLHEFLGGVPENISIRCVILFCFQRQTTIVNCLKNLFKLYPNEISIIGGFANDMHYDNRLNKSTSSNVCGIVLTGDKDHLNIRQVILGNDVNTRETVRDKLKQLKTNEIQESLSFAIQISCVARGSEFYNNQQNVECSEFRNLFPKTPLIGIFGNGEIGHDYLPNDEKLDENQTVEDLFCSYSSVFSLITIRM